MLHPDYSGLRQPRSTGLRAPVPPGRKHDRQATSSTSPRDSVKQRVCTALPSCAPLHAPTCRASLCRHTGWARPRRPTLQSPPVTPLPAPATGQCSFVAPSSPGPAAAVGPSSARTPPSPFFTKVRLLLIGCAARLAPLFSSVRAGVEVGRHALREGRWLTLAPTALARRRGERARGLGDSVASTRAGRPPCFRASPTSSTPPHPFPACRSRADAAPSATHPRC